MDQSPHPCQLKTNLLHAYLTANLGILHLDQFLFSSNSPQHDSNGVNSDKPSKAAAAVASSTAPAMNSHSHSQSTTNTSVEDGQEAPRRPRPASKAALLVLLLLIQLATSLYQLPLVRLIERRLCSDFYNNHNGDDAKSLPRSDDSSSSSTGGGIDESLCKVDHVQQHLAWILGAMETAWIVGGAHLPITPLFQIPYTHDCALQNYSLTVCIPQDFIMAIPLGFIAEKYGQKAVLRLNLIPRLFMLAWAPLIGLGFGETLPISLVILGPCLSFLGGDCVFGSITYSLAAGAVDDYIARLVSPSHLCST